MLTYADLHFHGRAAEPGGLPEFIGIPFRGALGTLLKSIVCQVSHGQCAACLLQSACPYPAIFEGLPPASRTIMRKYPQIPQPFVLVVAPPNAAPNTDHVEFSVRLFGTAIRFWPYVCHTFFRAAEAGIGRARTRITWDQVTSGADGQPIWTAAENQWSEPQIRPAVSLVAGSRSLTSHVDADPSASERQILRWRFLTPANFTGVSSRDMAEDFGLQLLLAGRRRLEVLNHFYGDSPAPDPAMHESSRRFAPEEFRTIEASVRPWGATRFSGRQQRRMTVEGFFGEALIEGPWSQTGPWLHAAPVIHVGKKTSFGFGRVEWEVVS